METKDMVEFLRGFACGLRDNGDPPYAEIMVRVADRLEELEKKYAAAVEAAAIATELAAKYRAVDGDLISRSELLKFPIRRDHYDRENGNQHFINGIETVFEYVETLPSVAAEPVVRAHWKLRGGLFRCTHCDAKALWSKNGGTHGYSCEYEQVEAKRCPECGAHMDEGAAK